jgi:anti-sigma-K factor RskA
MTSRPPTGGAPCEELRDMYELYALGLLETEEREEIEAHLARNCETCSKGVKQAFATNAIVSTFVPELEPPPALRKRVMSGVGVEHRSAWGWIAALVTAGLLVATLWFSLEARRMERDLVSARDQVRRTQADLARYEAALRFLDEPETKQVGFGRGEPQPPRGNVFVNPRSGVLLIAANLPPAPAGRIYEMWVIPKGGAPRPAGLFQSDASGSAIHILPGPLDVAATNAIAVTLEPESGSAGPTTTPIIVAPVGL